MQNFEKLSMFKNDETYFNSYGWLVLTYELKKKAEKIFLSNLPK